MDRFNVSQYQQAAKRWLTVEVPLPADLTVDTEQAPPLRIRVAYNPYTWTPAYKREYNRIQEETQTLLDALKDQPDAVAVEAALEHYRAEQRAWYNETLPKLLVAWEVYADEAAPDPLPINAETIDRYMPDVAMEEIFLAIGKDRDAARTNFTTRANGSDGGSTTPVSIRNARRKRTS